MNIPSPVQTPYPSANYSSAPSGILRLRLFPLDGGGGLGGDVVDDAVDALYLVYDAGRDLIQHIIGNPRPIRGHEVRGRDAPQGQGIVVGPPVAHDAHAAGIGQHGEVLIDVLLLTRGGDLLPEDGVRVPEGVQFLFGQVADDPDGKAGARERLPHDQIFRQSQLPAQLAHLVLEQQAQRLDLFCYRI